MIRNLIELENGKQIRSGSDAAYAIQTCTITESVNSGTELTPGSACCACLEATILDTRGDLKLSAGEKVVLYKEDDAGSKTRAGTFLLEAPTRKSENVYKITAYDAMTKLDKDLSGWLKGLTDWHYDLITFAGMVCDACELTLVTTDIPNGSFPVQKFYKAGVTGRRLMEWIGEIACRFCRANADGNIEFGWYTTLDPEEVTIKSTGERYYFAGALAYEDYTVGGIDAVQLRLADSDSGALWPQIVMGTVTYDYLRIRSGAGVDYDKVGELAQGDEVRIYEQKTAGGAVWGRIDRGWICLTGYVELKTVAADNPYIITGNAILLAKGTDDLPSYLDVIREQLGLLPAYKPCKVSLPAGMDIRPGHIVQIVDKHGNPFNTCVMTKTQTGQRDTLECTGSARRDSSTAANNQTAAQAAQQAVDGQTHEDVFNRLTKNGTIQGIYVQDNKWYINAEQVNIQNLKVKAADITDVITVEDASGNTLFAAGENAVTIAGWKVDNNSIWYEDLGGSGSMWLCREGTKNSPSSYGQIGIAGTDDTKTGWCITVGNNFGVDKEGTLFATGANITGTINASEGKVGDWNIGEKTIQCGTGTIYSGAALYSDPFYEDGIETAVILTPATVYVDRRLPEGRDLDYVTWKQILTAVHNTL